MASIIKKIKRKRKAHTWEQSIFSRKARALKRLQMLMVAQEGLAQMQAIRSAPAVGPEAEYKRQVACIQAAIATMKAVSAVARSKLQGIRTT